MPTEKCKLCKKEVEYPNLLDCDICGTWVCSKCYTVIESKKTSKRAILCKECKKFYKHKQFKNFEEMDEYVSNHEFEFADFYKDKT